MKLRTMVLVLAASMWMIPSLALAQDTKTKVPNVPPAAPKVATPPAASKAVETAIRYVKVAWINPATKSFQLTLMDATSMKVLINESGTGDTPVVVEVPDSAPSTPENTISVALPCGEKYSELACSGNVNIPVADGTPPGDDRLAQLVAKLREYHSWAVSKPRMNPRPPPNTAVNPRQPAVQPKAVQNPATREQPR